MRIGIDATCWAQRRGYGRFTRELVTAMVPLAHTHDLVCFLDSLSADSFTINAPNMRPIVVRQSAPPTVAAHSGGRRSLLDMLRLTKAVSGERLDVFFSPSVYGFFPLPPRLPAVITVHDAIPERFPSLTLPAAADRMFWSMKVRLALRQARLILTVSDYAADQIARHLGVSRSKMRVSLEGVAAAYRPSNADEISSTAARAGVPPGARWFIYVGGFGPHKYIELLVRAHSRVVQRHAEAAPLLFLVGAQHDAFFQDTMPIRNVITECGTENVVRWLGYVQDEELRHFQSGALALVLPSAAEGFGLPAVEAASCGTPVIATRESPLPQLLEGGGIFIPPGDVSALEAALERLLTNEAERQQMGQRALERARALSWTRSARVALDALQEAATQR